MSGAMLRCTNAFLIQQSPRVRGSPDLESALRLEGECGDRDHRPAESNNMPEDIPT
jgi:hypothetical protein